MLTVMAKTGSERLAEAINRRLDELGWDQAALARQSGVSDITIRRMQQGKAVEYRIDTKRKVAVALGWTPDSVDRVLRSLAPEVAGGTLPAGTAASGVDLSDLSAEDRARVQGYIDALRARRHYDS